MSGFLSRAYKFSKSWSLSGRYFLLAVARRQQLLPRRPAASAWDADTDNLEASAATAVVLTAGVGEKRKIVFSTHYEIGHLSLPRAHAKLTAFGASRFSSSCSYRSSSVVSYLAHCCVAGGYRLFGSSLEAAPLCRVR